jgi:hypothetical protein
MALFGERRKSTLEVRWHSAGRRVRSWLWWSRLARGHSARWRPLYRAQHAASEWQRIWEADQLPRAAAGPSPCRVPRTARRDVQKGRGVQREADPPG